jgi:ABC-type nitrate/sulfonate/bicarbonate transport system substrate-binding protein
MVMKSIEMEFGRAMSMVALAFLTVTSLAEAAPKKAKYVLLVGATPHYAAPVSAVEKGWCKEVGLNLEIKSFPSGNVAGQAFLTGQGDFVDTGDWAAVRSWLQTEDSKDPVVGLAPDTHYADLSLVMAQRSITDPKQLKGKKIGVWQGTTLEYFANLFLQKNGMSSNDVRLVNVQPAEMVPALDSGDLDAAVIWQPFGWKSQEVSGNKVHQLSTAKGYFTEYLVMSTRKSLLDNDPDAAKAFVACLKKGGEWTSKNHQAAAELVGNFFKVPSELSFKLISVMNMDPTFDAKFRAEMERLNGFMGPKGKSHKQIDWKKHFDVRGLMSADQSLVK